MGFLNKKLLLVVFICILIRIVFMFFPSYESDELAFRFWSQRLVTVGLSDFYSKDIFTNNPIGIFYFFFILSLIKLYFFPAVAFASLTFDIFLKIPANIADILTGLILIKFLHAVSREKIKIFLFFILNPFTIFVSAIWGQYDGLSTLFIILSSFFAVNKKNPYIGAIFYVCALAIKPQSIMYLPILLLIFLYNYKLKEFFLSILFSFFALVLIYLPFFPKNPIQGIITVNFGSLNLFDCTSCFTFNFWGIFGNWTSDAERIFSIPKVYWGVILYLTSLVPLLILPNLKAKVLSLKIYLATSLIILSFFMLQTRMHERYIYPLFPYLLLASIYLRNKIILGFYFIFSLLSSFNLYFAYAYNSNVIKNTHLPISIFEAYFSYFSLIYFLTFLIFYIYSFRILKKDD